MVVCRAVRVSCGVGLVGAALAGRAIATAQEAGASVEATNEYDEWERLGPAQGAFAKPNIGPGTTTVADSVLRKRWPSGDDPPGRPETPAINREPGEAPGSVPIEGKNVRRRWRLVRIWPSGVHDVKGDRMAIG